MGGLSVPAPPHSTAARPWRTLGDMRTRARGGLALLLPLALLAITCGGGGGDAPGVEVRAVTPVATATQPPAPAARAASGEPPELIVSADAVAQGGAILVSVTGDVRGGEVEFLGRVHPLGQGQYSMYAMVGVGMETPPGGHDLLVRFTSANGSAGLFERRIAVRATAWETAHIVYEGAPGEIPLDEAERAREEALLAETYALETPGKLWNGGWRLPSGGALTSQFGEVRSYSDGATGVRHGGADFGAAEGAPVLAANAGRVALARQLAVRGGTVVIDHGGGVLSSYAHLAAFAVAEGQMVQKGQVIAHVGSTGLSTAPHLHWEISVHGVLVDPLRFTDGRNGF